MRLSGPCLLLAGVLAGSCLAAVHCARVPSSWEDLIELSDASKAKGKQNVQFNDAAEHGLTPQE